VLFGGMHRPALQPNQNRQKVMTKQLSRIVSIIPIISVIIFFPACATQTNGVAKSDLSSALVQAGFKEKPATTPEQEQHLQSLPEHQFVVVRQHGQKFYLWADKPNKRLYSGNEQAYRAYKTNHKVAGATPEGGVTFIADPRGNAIAVTTYHGWAPFSEW
jgi:hypothetical protein